MKNRLVASGVAVSVALAGGVVAAPAASSSSFSDFFSKCTSTVNAASLIASQQNISKEDTWKVLKTGAGVSGSSAPGDAFSFCMELALKDPEAYTIAGPAAGIVLAIIVGELGLAGGAAWFLDQQGIVDLPL